MARTYTEEQRAKDRARARAYSAANPEKVRERARAYRESNRENYRARARAWRVSNPEKVRELVQMRYGQTLEERDARIAAQGGLCAVCGTPDPGNKGWCTDHDHARERILGKMYIRGILCHRCNVVTGMLGDQLGAVVERSEKIIEYLRRSGSM